MNYLDAEFSVADDDSHLRPNDGDRPFYEGPTFAERQAEIARTEDMLARLDRLIERTQTDEKE
jgi:hypothetical protein